MRMLINTLLLITLSGLILFVGCNPKDASTKTSEKTPKNSATPNQTDGELADKKTNDGEKKEATQNKPEKTQAAIAGKDEKEFVPKGWKQIDRITGNLNDDSLSDSVIQIENENAEEDDDFDRILLILFKTNDGKYRKGAEAKKIIRCTSCGGMLGGGPAEVKIEKGVLLISQMYGSREGTIYLHRFRFEKSSKKFLLIGEDVRNFDRGTGKADSTSTNYLTGKQIVTKEERNEKGDDMKTSKQEKTVAKTKRYIEEINYNKY